MYLYKPSCLKTYHGTIFILYIHTYNIAQCTNFYSVYMYSTVLLSTVLSDDGDDVREDVCLQRLLENHWIAGRWDSLQYNIHTLTCK